MSAATVAIFALIMALYGQGVVFYLVLKRIVSAGEHERRYLTSIAFADTPQQVVGLLAASRPDETVVAVAEAKAQAPRPSTVNPLGL